MQRFKTHRTSTKVAFKKVAFGKAAFINEETAPFVWHEIAAFSASSGAF
jgi:hypothetical protein